MERILENGNGGIMMEARPLRIGDITLRKPVFQGGMGIGISLSGLAGAVAGNWHRAALWDLISWWP